MTSLSMPLWARSSNDPRQRCWVEISLQQLAANFNAICAAVGAGVEVVPVVKADAYHHGALEVSKLLISEGARWLAVSSVEEGVSLRRDGISTRLVVLAGVLPWERTAVLEYQLTPVVHALEELPELGPIAYHLKIDTGMGRMGTRASAESIVDAVRKAPFARLEGLMTHFASAADFGSAQTTEQAHRFLGIRDALHKARLKPRFMHMSSTNPIVLPRPATWQNMVRPGLSLYGYWTSGTGQAPKPVIEIKPVLSWRTSILLIKDLPKGAQIGYGATYCTDRPTRTAVLGVGYADGLPHQLSNRGRVIAGGRFAPILGAVSMDLTTVDISDAPHLKQGDAVTIIGAEGDVSQDARHMADLAGTTPYTVLCGISARVKRLYR